MARSDKAASVAELVEDFKSADATVVTEYRGLTVTAIKELRRSLGVGTKYKVAESGYHTVEKGQTFYRIALIYGLSVDELKALNNLSNTTISVGQKLRVSK